MRHQPSKINANEARVVRLLKEAIMKEKQKNRTKGLTHSFKETPLVTLLQCTFDLAQLLNKMVVNLNLEVCDSPG